MTRLQKRLAQLESKLRYGANKFSKSQLFGIVKQILVIEAMIETTLKDVLDSNSCETKAVYLLPHSLPAFRVSEDVLRLPVRLQSNVDLGMTTEGFFIGSTAYLQEKWQNCNKDAEFFCLEMGW